MPMPSLDRSPRFTARCGLLLCLALIFSYLEVRLPLVFIPIPGFKPGFANLVIAFTAYTCGCPTAAVISVLRVLISSMLFGSVTGFWFSIAGAGASLLIMTVLLHTVRRYVSPLGICVASAAAHNIGQLTAASVLLSPAVFSYFPVLMAASLFTGTLTGFLLGRLLHSAERIPLLRHISPPDCPPTKKGSQ